MARKNNNLATSIGIELTYVPRYAVEFYTKHRVDLSEELCSSFVGIMRDKLKKADIDYHKCHTDPRCVEIPTKAFTERKALMQNIKAITKVAKDCDLITQPGYYCGGGAHIHAGIDRMLPPQEYGRGTKLMEGRKAFAARVQVFVGANPWLCWAFSGINDEYNAMPLHKNSIMGGMTPEDIKSELKSAEEMLRMYIDEKCREEKALHTAGVWQNSRLREGAEYDAGRYNSSIRNYRRTVRNLRAQLKALENKDENDCSYTQVKPNGCKSYAAVFRGETIEFRAFLMPHNVAELSRYIELVEAIMRKSRDMYYAESFNLANIYGGGGMKYKEAKAGFLSMLEGLGLDPANYRTDLLRMALRARYHKGLT